MPAWWGGLVLVVLTLAGVALFLRAQQSIAGNLWGVPLDDAYIHFRFAQNLASGHGFSFNPNQPVPASTSPLWVLLLAVPAAFGAPLWLAAKVYGIAFLAVSALLAWRLCMRLIGIPIVALAAGALTALDGRLLWAAPSGMEVTLFAALALAAFLVRPESDAARSARSAMLSPLLVAALCGLATLARPEGVLLSLVLAVDLWLRRRPPLNAVAAAVALYLVLVVPYGLFALLTTGHPLPTTFYAKAVGLGPGTLPLALRYIAVLIYYVITSNLALLLAPVGAVALWRLRPEARAVVAWPLLLILEQSILSPVLYHFGRYVMPLQPFFAIWAAVGIARLTRPTAGRQSWLTVLPPLALVVVAALPLGTWATLYGLSVRNIDDMQVTMGHWVRRHVPAGAPVATHDIGAIGYLSDHPVVDIVGLATPSFIALERETPGARRGRDLYAAVKRQGARYLIIIPKAYEDLAAQPGLRRLYSVTIRQPVIVPDKTMVVYVLTR